MTTGEQRNDQQIFGTTSGMSEAMQKNASAFWQNQEKLLEAMQTLAEGWFERRHNGTDAALKAAERICKAQTPAEALREYQEWASGSLQRMMSDALACQQQMMKIGPLLQPAPTPPVLEETTEAEATPKQQNNYSKAA